jgi:hypothetical protein
MINYTPQIYIRKYLRLLQAKIYAASEKSIKNKRRNAKL